VKVTTQADSGSVNLCISKYLKMQLGLELIYLKEVVLDGCHFFVA